MKRHAMVTCTALVSALSILGLLACKQKAPPVGTERGACYGNKTCNEGLQCLSGVCVRPPPPDCAKVAEKLSFLTLSNYAKRAERQAYISRTTTTCMQAKLTHDEADCILEAKNRGALTRCPKPLALGNCERVLAHERKILSGDNAGLSDMLDPGPALRRCQQQGISREYEDCVTSASTKEQLDRCRGR